ncbi:MAG: branched-chain amino acid ABC transporter permease [Firmicutes bacterium]|nr:branched-chain amino acid ABC transporter permease [Bacillota bacterium]
MGRRTRCAVAVGVVTLLAVFPLLGVGPYYIRLLNLAGIYVILTLGLNFCVGMAGQISYAQASFFGIGAYASALLTLKAGVSFWAALPLSALVALVFGVLLGLPSLKVGRYYLAIVTIGFSEIVRLVLLNWKEVTYGAEGVKNIPVPTIGAFTLNTDLRYYYLVLTIVLFAVFVSIRIVHSRIGRALHAIRMSDLAAEVMGVNTRYYKILAFALSAFFGGLAGSLIAHYDTYLHANSFNFMESAKILCMLFIGGSGSIEGPIIGAVGLTLLPEWLRFLKDYYMAIYGVGVVLLMSVMPSGIRSLIPQLARFVQRLFTNKQRAVRSEH